MDESYVGERPSRRPFAEIANLNLGIRRAVAEDGPASEFGDLVLYDRDSGSIVALVPFDQLFDPAGFPFHFDQP